MSAVSRAFLVAGIFYGVGIVVVALGAHNFFESRASKDSKEPGGAAEK